MVIIVFAWCTVGYWMAMFCIARYGLAWHGTVWCLSKLSYIVIRQLGKQSAVLSSRHWGGGWLQKPSTFKESSSPNWEWWRVTRFAWQIDFDRRERDADIGISHRGTASVLWQCAYLRSIIGCITYKVCVATISQKFWLRMFLKNQRAHILSKGLCPCKPLVETTYIKGGRKKVFFLKKKKNHKHMYNI